MGKVPKMAQNDPKWLQKEFWTSLGPSGPTHFDSRGSGPTWSHGQAGSKSKKGRKMAQNGPKWLKMAQKGPRRHWVTNFDPTWGVRTHLEPQPPPKWIKKGNLGVKSCARSPNGAAGYLGATGHLRPREGQVLNGYREKQTPSISNPPPQPQSQHAGGGGAGLPDKCAKKDYATTEHMLPDTRRRQCCSS